jgi:hypothetical protein
MRLNAMRGAPVTTALAQNRPSIPAAEGTSPHAPVRQYRSPTGTARDLQIFGGAPCLRGTLI